MRQIETFSAYQITNEFDFGFLPDDYSKFKHGSATIARKFGYDLADKFILKYSRDLISKPLVVVPSAFSHIHTASGAMARFFVDRLNQFLYKTNNTSVEQTKISRTVTYREDYGEMSAEERFNMIKGDKFHIDKVFLENKTLIFIDDIKITGTHERIIVKMLDDFKIENDCYMLYYGDLQNPSINPRIENVLNQHFVKNLNQIDEIIKTDTFIFNTRVVKYILNSSTAACLSFLQKQSDEFIRELYYLALGNCYGQFKDYEINLQLIEDMIRLEEYSLSHTSAQLAILA